MTFTRSFLEIPLIFFYLHQLLSDFEEKLQEILRNFDEMKSSNNNNNNNNKNKTKQNKKQKTKNGKQDQSLWDACMSVCNHFLLQHKSDRHLPTHNSINYRFIYNTCTCIKPSQILLKFGIKVAIYCTVLCFFLLFFLSV